MVTETVGLVAAPARNRERKLVWEARIHAKRGRGRPSETWDSVMGSILKKRGKLWSEPKESSKNRNQFVFGK